MAEIKITPEELERIAGNFKNAAGEAQSQINRLEGDINSLEGQWLGQHKRSSVENLSNLNKQCNNTFQF